MGGDGVRVGVGGDGVRVRGWGEGEGWGVMG